MTASLECDASGLLRLCDVSKLLDTTLPATMHSIGSKACDIAQSLRDRMDRYRRPFL